MKRVQHPEHRAERSRRGAALILAIVMLTFLAGLTLAFFAMTSAAHKEHRASGEALRGTCLAEAAVREAVEVYRKGGRAGVDALVYPRNLGGSSFDVTVTWGEDEPLMADDLVLMVGRAQTAREDVALELLFRGDPPLFFSGIRAKSDLSLDDDCIIDSYDTGLGTYASQATNTFNGEPYADSNAPVTCNDDIDLDSDSAIFGDGQPGPTGTTSTSGGSMVTGSTTPLAAPLAFPPFSTPSFPSAGDLSLNSGSLTLSPGNYQYDELELDGTGVLTIEGPATVVFDEVDIESNSRLWIDAAGGPVEIYVAGEFEQEDDSIIGPTSGNPSDLAFFFGTSTHDIDLEASFTGTIYAPDRRLDIDKGAEIWGSLAADRIDLDDDARVHFDEALLSSGGPGAIVEVICWRPTN